MFEFVFSCAESRVCLILPKKKKKKKKSNFQSVVCTTEPQAGPSSTGDTMDGESVDMDEGMQMYDCVICNQSTASTAEKTIGLVVFLQASSGNIKYFTAFYPLTSMVLTSFSIFKIKL